MVLVASRTTCSTRGGPLFYRDDDVVRSCAFTFERRAQSVDSGGDPPDGVGRQRVDEGLGKREADGRREHADKRADEGVPRVLVPKVEQPSARALLRWWNLSGLGEALGVLA